jgi:ketosteroid isomerase-like protein
VIQSAELVLEDHGDAVRWNASLPCGGEVESVTERGDAEVLVVFRLTERPRHACDAPGGRGAAIFRIRDGKIVLWHQTRVPESESQLA